MATKRVFVSLEVPEDIKEKIAVLITNFSELYPHPKENFHITVKFMGDIEESQIGLLESLMQFAAQNIRPLPVDFEGIEPVESRLRLVAKKTAAFQLLFDTIISNWQKVAPVLEDKIPFQPHVTLGKFPKVNKLEAVLYNFSNLNFTADTLVLYETQQGEKTAMYVPLKKVKLTGV